MTKADIMAHAALLGTKTLLRTVGFRRTSALLHRLSPEPRPTADWGDSRYMVLAVHRATRHRGFAGTCLERSLAAWWLLRLKRLPADLRIGARLGENGLEAHAWLEQNGRILNDDPAVIATYAPFPNTLSPDRLPDLIS